MNKTLLALAVVATATAANAQSYQQDGKATWKQHVKQIVTQSSKAAKTTATQQRVIASGMYMNQGTGLQLIDSSEYVYSGERGSSFDFNYLEYYAYNGQGNVQADTATNYSISLFGGQIMPNNRTLNAWDNMNRATESTSQSYNGTSFEDSYRNLYTYDANGNMTEELTLSWINNAWDSVYMRKMYYNAQNKLVADTVYNRINNTWKATSASSYTYNANGNMTGEMQNDISGGVVTPDYRATYTYNTSNKLETSLYEEYQGGSWVNEDLDTFGYTNNVDFYTYEEYRTWNNGAWEPSEKTEKTLNAQNLPDTLRQYTWNGTSWDMDFEGNITYNSYNNPEHILGYNVMTGTPVLFAEIFFYYELYNTSVKDVAKTNVALYPNPASDNITIKTDADMAVVRVINTLGQTVINQTVKGKTADISVSHLQPGVYMVNILDTKNNSVTKQIVKQ